MRRRFVAVAVIVFVAAVARADDLCTAIKCGEVGGKCDENTVCPLPTVCQDGTCRYNKAGDNCTYMCTGSETYCNRSSGKCVNYLKKGDDCTSGSCDSGLFCYNGDNTCHKYPEGDGDECIYLTSICPGTLRCTANRTQKIGVCHELPGKEGAECKATVGCDPEKELVCKDGQCKSLPGKGDYCYLGACKLGLACNEEGKCDDLPGENEKCQSAYGCKGDDLYCDNTCKKLPGDDEFCSTSTGCRSGYSCVTTTLLPWTTKCKKSEPEKGDYCHTVYGPRCTGNYNCVKNVCEEPTVCFAYDSCPGFPEKICKGDKCVDSMTGDEGESCSIAITATLVESTVAATFQCKEGYGCVSGKCTKIETKLDDHRKCTDGYGCPTDSFCGCNDKDGITQCIPLPYADKDIRDDVKKVYELASKCTTPSKDTDSCKELAEKTEDLSDDIDDKFYSYTATRRCDLFAGASAVKASLTVILGVVALLAF